MYATSFTFFFLRTAPVRGKENHARSLGRAVRHTRHWRILGAPKDQRHSLLQLSKRVRITLDLVYVPLVVPFAFKVSHN